MSKKSFSLAVLMTSHNRRKITLSCLECIDQQYKIANIDITIYLVDDGSTDGTAKAIKESYPDVNILKGDGSLYWVGGMHKAMAAAMDQGFDLYLWLNDDSMLYPYALKNLIAVYKKRQQINETGIVVGSLCDPDTGEWTYGASVHISSWHPLRFKPVKPENEIKEADNFWGNVVLIPGKVVNKIGNLDNKFDHGGGDHDYALRAKKAGFKIWVAPNYVGECARNPIKGTWKDRRLSLIKRLNDLLSIKNQSIHHRFHFLKKHSGIWLPIIFFTPYIRLLWDHLVYSLLGDKQEFEPEKNYEA